MRPLPEATSLEYLSRQVQDIQNHRGPQNLRCLLTGWDHLDQTLGRGLPRGVVQEWFGTQGPPLSILGHLAGRAMAEQAGGWAVWIGREMWPYPRGLTTEGTERKQAEKNICDLSSAQWPRANDKSQMANSSPAALSVVKRSLWLQPANEDDRLWTIDQAVRCPAVTAVVADGSNLNMAATRRLQLSAKTGNALVLLIRPPRERAELSAAALRWLVSPARSPNRHPRWTVELLRHKGHALEGPQRMWLLERNRAQGLVDLSAELRRGTGGEETQARRRTA